MCVATWNVAVVKRWMEVAYPEEIANTIDIPSPVGTALCMAAAVKKDHEIGNARTSRLSNALLMPIIKFDYQKLCLKNQYDRA